MLHPAFYLEKHLPQETDAVLTLTGCIRSYSFDEAPTSLSVSCSFPSSLCQISRQRHSGSWSNPGPDKHEAVGITKTNLINLKGNTNS